MPSMWVFDDTSFGEIVRDKLMSHLQPPEPQPSTNSARTTYGRPREGQPSLPLQPQNNQPPAYPQQEPQQPSCPQYQPQEPQYPLFLQNEPQESQYLEGSGFPQEPPFPPFPPLPPFPQSPQYQPQTTRTTQNPPQLAYPDQPKSPSTRITQNPPQLSYPAQVPPAYKQKPTLPPYQQQQSFPEFSPKKKYSDWIFPRRDYSRWIIVTLVSGVLALLLIGVLTVASANGNGTGVRPNHSTGTTVSQTGVPATATPPRTGRQGTQPIFAPVLGGTVSDFSVQYGIAEDPTNNEGGLWQHVTIAGQPVSLSVSTAPSQDSRDGDLHVMNLVVQTTSNATWNAATQQGIMAVLLPPDAKLVRQVATGNGNEIIYTSAQLAATFQDSLFTNDAGKTVTPGTFNEQCFLAGTAVQAGGAATACWLTVGEI